MQTWSDLIQVGDLVIFSGSPCAKFLIVEIKQSRIEAIRLEKTQNKILFSFTDSPLDEEDNFAVYRHGRKIYEWKNAGNRRLDYL